VLGHDVSFTVATYNVLATAYIRAEWYPNTPVALFDASHRVPALVRHVVALEADVLCLQEVERDVFAALEEHLRAQGYAGAFAGKGRGRPDGCATFFRTAMFTLVEATPVEYRDAPDGRAESGHVAQLVRLQHARRTLGVANTHLKWDPPATPREAQYGYRQAAQLLAECGARAATAWIVCGDLNATPESDVVTALRAAGLQFTHQAEAQAHTCNSNATAKTIDYLFHSSALRSTPAALPVVGDHTPLPGGDEPSDHIAVSARFEWVALSA
jgi:mRNA deadenylase 3'-5' endonuclease subunit Ccr4